MHTYDPGKKSSEKSSMRLFLFPAQGHHHTLIIDLDQGFCLIQKVLNDDEEYVDETSVSLMTIFTFVQMLFRVSMYVAIVTEEFIDPHLFRIFLEEKKSVSLSFSDISHTDFIIFTKLSLFLPYFCILTSFPFSFSFFLSLLNFFLFHLLFPFFLFCLSLSLHIISIFFDYFLFRSLQVSLHSTLISQPVFEPSLPRPFVTQKATLSLFVLQSKNWNIGKSRDNYSEMLLSLFVNHSLNNDYGEVRLNFLSFYFSIFARNSTADARLKRFRPRLPRFRPSLSYGLITLTFWLIVITKFKRKRTKIICNN